MAALVSPEAAKLFEEFGINNDLRMAHLLANWCAETGGFQIVWESGAYSANRIMQIFGVGKHSAKITWREAQRLAYNGPALFDRVYGVGNPRKVRELGNDRPGDGWKYRGVGIVQITGKRDHYRYAAEIGIPVEDLAKPLPSIHAALLEWRNKGCNEWADKDDVKRVRRLINGGYNGLSHVRSYLAKAKRLLREDHEVDDMMLSLGDEGPKVVWLQEQLIAHGYPLGAVDGVFGPMTERALVSWQLQHEMEATGRLDLKNDEIRTALEETPKDDPVVAAREVTKEDLKERGSKTVESTSFWKTFMGWIFGAGAFAGADTTSGFGVIDSIVTQGEQVKSVAERTSGLMQWVPDTRVLIIIAIAVAAFILYRVFANLEKRRIEDARSGVHLGR